MDGVVENDGSWFDPTDDSEQGQQLAEITREHAAASDGFLVGRVTFEEMREFWPRQIDDRTGVTDHLNRVEKYVVSRGMDDPHELRDALPLTLMIKNKNSPSPDQKTW